MRIRHAILLALLAGAAGAVFALNPPADDAPEPGPPAPPRGSSGGEPPPPGDGPEPRGPAGPVLLEEEPNDEPGQARALAPGGAARARGAISRTGSAEGLPAGDRDLYRIEPPATGLVAATLRMPAGADFDLALLDAGGRRLATSRSNNLRPGAEATERLYARVAAGKARLLEVGGYAGKPGDYELEVRFAAAPAVKPAGEWATAPAGDLGSARCFHAAAALFDGRAIVGGGTQDAGSGLKAFLSALSDTEIFDPRNGKWSRGPGTGMPRFGATATLLPDGRVLFAGGDMIGSAALFDPRADRMVKSDIPLSGGTRVLHTAELLPDGRVLLAGGLALDLEASGQRRPLATSEVFDPKTLLFAEGPALLAPRYSHASCRLADGRILVTGGVGRSDTEVLDVRGSPSRAAPGPPLAGVRDDHTATTLADGRVLVAGGQDRGSRSLVSAELLDDAAAPATARFRPLPAGMGDRRSDHAAVLLPDGRVLLLGGESDPGTDRDVILRTVDVFDPRTLAFAPLSALAAGRDDHRAVLLLDGRVLVTGGENERSAAVPSTELYSPR